jgi:NurA-like 5'-3' nuclease
MEFSYFRKSLKCWYNDTGYCKFGEECQKRHFHTICMKTQCDNKCEARHPRLCKFKTKCKFFKKGVCAFKHATLAVDDEETYALKIKMEILKKENKDLRKTVKVLEESFETRMKTVTNDKESNIDALKLKVKLLEETLQLQTRLEEKLISTAADSHEVPSDKLNAEEPELLDISNCETYPCDKCDFEFDEEDDLDAHNEIYHENPCDICDINFEEEDALQTHKERHHENKCNICDIAFADEGTLQKHKEIYHKNRCNICDYESTTEKGLKIHNGKKHKESNSSTPEISSEMCDSEPTTENQHKEDEIFSCDKCQLKFVGSKILNQHKQAMHCAFLSF